MSNVDLCNFADEVLAMIDGGCDVEASDIHECAQRNGLIKPVEVTKSCGEYCECAYYSDFPCICYKRTDW